VCVSGGVGVGGQNGLPSARRRGRGEDARDVYICGLTNPANCKGHLYVHVLASLV